MRPTRHLLYGFAAGMMAAVAFAVVTAVVAQQPATTPPPIPKGSSQSAVPAGAAADVVDALTPCQLVFCDTDPRKVLVLNTEGKVVVDARSLQVELALMGKTPKVSCQVFAGPYSPSKPLVRQWRLTTLKFATPDEFQKLVDQADTEFVDSLKTVKPVEGPGTSDEEQAVPAGAKG